MYFCVQALVGGMASNLSLKISTLAALISSAWKFVPFWHGSWLEIIFVIIYVRSHMHKFIVCLIVLGLSV